MSPAIDPTYYQHERYLPQGGAHSRRLTRVYYRLKPLLPRASQVWLRRLYAPVQARKRFPTWPAEPLLVDNLHAEVRAQLRETGAERIPLVPFWPHGHRYAAVLTHDVEGPVGIKRIPQLLEIERRHGFASSWNFCAEWYEIPPDTFAMLRRAGCEIGLHGIKHDGRLFESRETFTEELPKIHHYLREWDVAGFRSPATHRNAEWMQELDCLYDSSFFDTDPFEPQPGGCCSIFPFFFGDVVELPITLVQDWTLWAILRRNDIGLWRDKARWVAERHGLVNVIVHPDYVDSPKRLAQYEELLVFLKNELPGGWHTLPRDVAAWWRVRAQLRVSDDGAEITGFNGGDAVGAIVTWARETDGRIVFESSRGESRPARGRNGEAA